MRISFSLFVIFLILTFLLASCNTSQPIIPTSTIAPTSSLTNTVTNTPTLTPTFTITPTRTPTVSPSPTNTHTPTPTPKPLPRLRVDGTNLLDDQGNIFRIKSIRMPLDFMPCPSMDQIKKFVEKAAEWKFNAIDIGIDPERLTCKRNHLLMALEVTNLANQHGLYTLLMIAPLHKPSQYGESALTFNPPADVLDRYVAWWRNAGKLIDNNPGVAAIQVYNEFDYTRNMKGDWRIIAQKRGQAWRTLVEPFNLNACEAVREGSPDIICVMVSADVDIWLPDAVNFGSFFTRRFPPPNSMIAFHPYNITIDSEKACEKPPTDATWWCYPVNRQWINFLEQGKALIFSEIGYFETGPSIGEPYKESIDEAAFRLQIAEDLDISWTVLGPFWSGGGFPAAWLKGLDDDDLEWEKILKPILSQ